MIVLEQRVKMSQLSLSPSSYLCIDHQPARIESQVR